MADRKSKLEMFADLAREGGLLWVIFGLLDWLMRGDTTKTAWSPTSWVEMVLIVGAVLIVGGVVAERVR